MPFAFRVVQYWKIMCEKTKLNDIIYVRISIVFLFSFWERGKASERWNEYYDNYVSIDVCVNGTARLEAHDDLQVEPSGQNVKTEIHKNFVRSGSINATV